MKIKYFLLTAVIALLFVSCDEIDKIENKSVYSAHQMAEIILAPQDNMPDLEFLLPDDDYFAYYFSDIYQLGDSMLKDGVIYYADGMSAYEIAVFLFSDTINIEQKEAALLRYIKQRASDFTGYDPEQTAVLEKGVVVTRGQYIALLICGDSQKAKSDFLACFSDNPPEYIPYITNVTEKTPEITTVGRDVFVTPPTNNDNTSPENDDTPEITTIDDTYDSDAILPDKNQIILAECMRIIAEIITDGMDEYEKELAVHDWIISWADYDKEANNNAPNASPDPDNDNPYGLLFNKKAICSGYSSTFQLFMDLLNIECITVSGFSGVDADSEHAWNMVRIDGNWYCVDVTWDDPSGEYDNSATHKYFNVTSDFMRETTHHWDESSTPVANAGKLYR